MERKSETGVFRWKRDAYDGTEHLHAVHGEEKGHSEEQEDSPVVIHPGQPSPQDGQDQRDRGDHRSRTEQGQTIEHPDIRQNRYRKDCCDELRRKRAEEGRRKAAELQLHLCELRGRGYHIRNPLQHLQSDHHRSKQEDSVHRMESGQDPCGTHGLHRQGGQGFHNRPR